MSMAIIQPFFFFLVFLLPPLFLASQCSCAWWPACLAQQGCRAARWPSSCSSTTFKTADSPCTTTTPPQRHFLSFRSLSSRSSSPSYSSPLHHPRIAGGPPNPRVAPSTRPPIPPSQAAARRKCASLATPAANARISVLVMGATGFIGCHMGYCLAPPWTMMTMGPPANSVTGSRSTGFDYRCTSFPVASGSSSSRQR